MFLAILPFFLALVIYICWKSYTQNKLRTYYQCGKKSQPQSCVFKGVGHRQNSSPYVPLEVEFCKSVGFILKCVQFYGYLKQVKRSSPYNKTIYGWAGAFVQIWPLFFCKLKTDGPTNHIKLTI